MKNYMKPVVMMNDEMIEGVYAASGKDCYTCRCVGHQKPQEGRNDYRFQFDATHAAGDAHHGGTQVLELTFNQPVKYVSSNGQYVYGNGSNKLAIKYKYHQNGNDYIGLGDVVVESEPGLTENPKAVLWCNHDCGQH